MADTQKAATGVLVCLVYRYGTHTVYFDSTGEPEGLELAANIRVGGDWEEANVLYEDGPPMPPQQSGLWRMEWPWRSLTEQDFEDGESRELCCRYVGPTSWTLVLPPLAAPSPPLTDDTTEPNG